MRILLALVTGRVQRSAAFDGWLAETVQLRASGGALQLAADGETWDGPGELVVRKRPGALRLLQP
jgi:hypothetical protein